MPSAFGELLVTLLAEKTWSIPFFAEKVNLHRSFIGFIVRGERLPPMDAIERWATVIGITGARREEFLLLAALEHTPDLVRQKLAELQDQVRKRR